VTFARFFSPHSAGYNGAVVTVIFPLFWWGLSAKSSQDDWASYVAATGSEPSLGTHKHFKVLEIVTRSELQQRLDRKENPNLPRKLIYLILFSTIMKQEL
jgi:hypothetical protein